LTPEEATSVGAEGPNSFPRATTFGKADQGLLIVYLSNITAAVKRQNALILVALERKIIALNRRHWALHWQLVLRRS